MNFKRHLDFGWIMVKNGSSFEIIDDKVKGFYILCCGGERSRRTAVLSRAVVALVGQTVPEDIEARGEGQAFSNTFARKRKICFEITCIYHSTM